MLKIDIISCLEDNYTYLIQDQNTNSIGVVDPSAFNPVDRIIKKKYGKLDYILNTHHHSDHVGGNNELKKKYKCKIVGSKIDKERIPGIDVYVDEKNNFMFGKIIFKIICVPGHTNGHISFYSKEENVIFTGDTLFSLGCGRLFEGTYKEMFHSLNKIKKLSKKTKIYCGHEYTKKNLEFCLNYEKQNKLLNRKSIWVKSKLNEKLPTIPTTLEDEIKTNIFLRCDNSNVKNNLKMRGASDELVFKKLRYLKDEF